MRELTYDCSDYIAFTKQNRQWTRPLRLAHAKLLVKTAKSDEEKEFWRRVAKDNTVLPYRK